MKAQQKWWNNVTETVALVVVSASAVHGCLVCAHSPGAPLLGIVLLFWTSSNTVLPSQSFLLHHRTGQ